MSIFSTHSLAHILVSLLPVLVFLSMFFYLDSYKLIHPRSIVLAILAGAASAAAAFLINIGVQASIGAEGRIVPLYIGPAVEEAMKAGYIVLLLRRAKIGFLVDAAIYGIAVGAGFALVENVYYLDSMGSNNILVWIIRGFGTAIMHGGVTAIFALVAKYYAEQNERLNLRALLPGYFLAFAIHSAFNHAFFPPVIMTIMVILFFPAVLYLVFQKSQQATKDWLRQGMDSDIAMLEVILSGDLGESHVGKYLQSIQSRFRGDVIADMLCLLRLNLEVSMHAKGVLMMREAGVDLPPDPETPSKLKEMEYLEKHIGTVGMLALQPFLPHSTRELWQLNLVQ